MSSHPNDLIKLQAELIHAIDELVCLTLTPTQVFALQAESYTITKSSKELEHWF
jgi:hypothetical protein